MQASEIMQSQNRRRQQPAKRTRQRSRNDEERHAKGQLALAIPSREVQNQRRHHARLKDAEKESNGAQGGKVGDKGIADGEDAEAKRGGGDKPSWPDVFAECVAGNLEENVGDVKDGEGGIIVEAMEAQVFVETGYFGVA